MLFKGWGIRAIQGDIKTMTRRIIKPQPIGEYQGYKSYLGFPASVGKSWFGFGNPADPCYYTPKIQIGEIFYARETYWIDPVFKDDPLKGIYYKADPDFYKKDMIKWKSSMFMSEKYARLFCKCTDVKAERAQDISEEDAKKEGVKPWIPDIELYPGCIEEYKARGGSYRNGFHDIWISINGQKSWDSNPWVWAYTFERVEK